jgi:DNA-binding transcriptional MerR regulator
VSDSELSDLPPQDDDHAPGNEPVFTIGRVCDALKPEFPNISISKIRFLEDQKLITPLRTGGGYRKYRERDIDRLRTILRLQRDEFLPLRVIRQELESSTTGSFSVANQARQLKRANLTEPAPTLTATIDELIDRTGAPRAMIQSLEQFGLIGDDSPEGSYSETDREIVQTAIELAAFGVEPRHMRQFRVAAEREAGLLEQVLATGLRSKNPDRRKEALQELENLAALASHLRHLMLVSELRKIVGT